MLFAGMEAAERSGDFAKAWASLTDGQRGLVIQKLQKRSNVDIAKEEGTTEAAVRNRLKKIQKKFEKFLR
jgi:DNA-directed RNA polymerase specialized sigma24 family protein